MTTWMCLFRDRGDDFLLPLCSGGRDERRGLTYPTVGAYQLDTRCATVERNHLMAIGGKTWRPGPRSPDAEPKTPLALQGGFPLAAAPVRRQRDELEDDMAKKTARGRRQDRRKSD